MDISSAGMVLIMGCVANLWRRVERGGKERPRDSERLGGVWVCYYWGATLYARSRTSMPTFTLKHFLFATVDHPRCGAMDADREHGLSTRSFAPTTGSVTTDTRQFVISNLIMLPVTKT